MWRDGALGLVLSGVDQGRGVVVNDNRKEKRVFVTDEGDEACG